jgi:hypothetical protein
MPDEAMINLVKAYDTIDHELLILVLVKYGVPEHLRRMVATLYENLVISFLLGKEKRKIHQSVGSDKVTIWPLYSSSL